MIILSTLALLMGCGEKEEDSGDAIAENPPADSADLQADERCPLPSEDDCMTEELYAECLEVAASCEGDILTQDSCPYGGFSCD